MHATDAGGVYRDMLEIMCTEVQGQILDISLSLSVVTLVFAGPWLTLLTPCPNQRSAMGSCQDRFVPRASLKSSEQITYFEFLGQLFGLAFRTRSLLPLNLPPIIWYHLCLLVWMVHFEFSLSASQFNSRKLLVGTPITRQDVEQVLAGCQKPKGKPMLDRCIGDEDFGANGNIIGGRL